MSKDYQTSPGSVYYIKEPSFYVPKNSIAHSTFTNPHWSIHPPLPPPHPQPLPAAQTLLQEPVRPLGVRPRCRTLITAHCEALYHALSLLPSPLRATLATTNRFLAGELQT